MLQVIDLSAVVVRRRTDGVPNARKTDGSELRNMLDGTEMQKRGGSMERKGRCGTYNVGMKDLASAYVLCPRLAECGGLSIYGRNRGLQNNEGIGSGVMTWSRKWIRTEY